MTNLKDAILNTIPAAILFIVGMYVSLGVLETKFDYMEVRAKERYELLLEIKAASTSNTLALNTVANNYNNLDHRVIKIEYYIPSHLMKMDKEITKLSKDVELLTYKLEKKK